MNYDIIAFQIGAIIGCLLAKLAFLYLNGERGIDWSRYDHCIQAEVIADQKAYFRKLRDELTPERKAKIIAMRGEEGERYIESIERAAT